jgi:GxxExxY protein
MSSEEWTEEQVWNLARDVARAVVDAHEATGPGLDESAYQEVISRELDRRGLPHDRHPDVPFVYEGKVLMTMRPDFLICGVIVLEVRATEDPVPEDFQEVRTHMRAAGAALGLLVHMNAVIVTESDVFDVHPWRRVEEGGEVRWLPPLRGRC